MSRIVDVIIILASACQVSNVLRYFYIRIQQVIHAPLPFEIEENDDF